MREGRRGGNGTTTFHVTSRDITAARDEQPSLSRAGFVPRDKGPPFSIARSLSRNGPLDFTLRSRYKTISIPFRQRFRRRRDFRPIFPPGSGVLRGPLYLGHSGFDVLSTLSTLSTLFMPRSTHIVPIDAPRTRLARCPRARAHISPSRNIEYRSCLSVRWRVP